MVTILAVVWLGTAVLIKLPYTSLQEELRSSVIISTVNQLLPPAPRVISDLGHLINPNGFPQVFTSNEPTPQSIALPSPGSLQTAVTKDAASVVKIEGKGCGGIVEGSGFIAATNLVATNAHVIAGVAHPFVVDGKGRHAATPVWFDADLDFAVLKVSGLAGQPLAISHTVAAGGTQSAVLGYPGGGDFNADPATVLEKFTADGRNIYNQGNTTRDVYEVRANIVPGNSGGPLVNQEGTVIGVVFAQSTVYNQVGYALTTPSILQDLAQAQAHQQTTDTGSCAE